MYTIKSSDLKSVIVKYNYQDTFMKAIPLLMNYMMSSNEVVAPEKYKYYFTVSATVTI